MFFKVENIVFYVEILFLFGNVYIYDGKMFFYVGHTDIWTYIFLCQRLILILYFKYLMLNQTLIHTSKTCINICLNMLIYVLYIYTPDEKYCIYFHNLLFAKIISLGRIIFTQEVSPKLLKNHSVNITIQISFNRHHFHIWMIVVPKLLIKYRHKNSHTKF